MNLNGTASIWLGILGLLEIWFDFNWLFTFSIYKSTKIITTTKLKEKPINQSSSTAYLLRGYGAKPYYYVLYTYTYRSMIPYFNTLLEISTQHICLQGGDFYEGVSLNLYYVGVFRECMSHMYVLDVQ